MYVYLLQDIGTANFSYSAHPAPNLNQALPKLELQPVYNATYV